MTDRKRWTLYVLASILSVLCIYGGFGHRATAGITHESALTSSFSAFQASDDKDSVQTVSTLDAVGRQTRDEIPAPADVFGFKPGTPYKLADYGQILKYFRALEEASNRVVLKQIGTTTLGRPMIMAIISSEENLQNRKRYREINRRLAYAEGLSKEKARQLAAEGKATVWIDGGLHSNEVAHSQHTSELAYWLAASESEEARRVREEVITLLCPVVNPDGQDMIVEWYRENRGTPFETAPLPKLYHKYVGHDNNRDWYMFTQKETQAVADVYYHEWFPQITYNHHQTGPFPGRIWVPPSADPLNPNIDPLVAANTSHIGQNMLTQFMKEGKAGVSTGIGYRVIWAPGFMSGAPKLHNMIGIFTETALYGYGTPHCYTEEEVGDTFKRGIPQSTKTPSVQYPEPWEGGCWGVRDAMNYMMTASQSTLDLASEHREDLLYNIYHMGQRQIARGKRAEEGGFAYVINMKVQHDRNAAMELLQVFRQAGIEIHRADGSFTAGGQEYPEGAYVIGPQAFRPFVVDLMEPKMYPERYRYSKKYPDRFRLPEGPPERPYDLTGYSLPLQMGVKYDRVDEPFAMPGPTVEEISPPSAEVQGKGQFGYLLSHDPNASASAVNRLLKGGAQISWASDSFEVSGERWPAGTFVVQGANRDTLKKLAQELGLNFAGVDSEPDVALQEIRAPKIGIYQSYVANMAEGWTRWVLDKYKFKVDLLHDKNLQQGDLNQYDIIVIADQSPEDILRGHPPQTMPSKYVGGMGAEGAAALKRYVEEGGWVLSAHESVEFVASQFGLPVQNAVEGVPSQKFFIPGSLIRITTKPTDPLAYGMAEKAVATTWEQALVMKTTPAAKEDSSAAGKQVLEQEAEVYARFPEEEKLLLDGLAIGEEQYLAGRSAAMRLPLGKGTVVLLGFRPDTRGQSRNTFKLLFNPLYASTIEGGLESFAGN